jgi:hypothetical protein
LAGVILAIRYAEEAAGEPALMAHARAMLLWIATTGAAPSG